MWLKILGKAGYYWAQEGMTLQAPMPWMGTLRDDVRHSHGRSATHLPRGGHRRFLFQTSAGLPNTPSPIPRARNGMVRSQFDRLDGQVGSTHFVRFSVRLTLRFLPHHPSKPFLTGLCHYPFHLPLFEFFQPAIHISSPYQRSSLWHVSPLQPNMFARLWKPNRGLQTWIFRRPGKRLQPGKWRFWMSIFSRTFIWAILRTGIMFAHLIFNLFSQAWKVAPYFTVQWSMWYFQATFFLPLWIVMKLRRTQNDTITLLQTNWR